MYLIRILGGSVNKHESWCCKFTNGYQGKLITDVKKLSNTAYIYLASPQASFGVRSSRGGEMNAWRTNPKDVCGEAAIYLHSQLCDLYCSFFSVSLPYMLRSKVSELLCTSSAVYIVCLQYLSFWRFDLKLCHKCFETRQDGWISIIIVSIFLIANNAFISGWKRYVHVKISLESGT